jgi:DNA-binding beta-propeller fold protein YncE
MGTTEAGGYCSQKRRRSKVAGMKSSRPTSSLTVAALAILFAGASADGAPRTSPSPCNAAAASALSYVQVPGHPFSTVLSRDGCWLFVSLTTADPRSLNGVAMFERSGGQIRLRKVFAVEGEPTGMVMTHDGKLLIVADGDFVVFMDVERMIAGSGDPIVGFISDGDYPGSVYVNVTADDSFLFVSDEAVRSISVINLRLARANGFEKSAIVGQIPVGAAPIALTFSNDQRWLYTTSQIAPNTLGWPIECKPEGADPATAAPKNPQGAIFVIDVARAQTDPANSVIARIPAGCSPVRMAISPAGDRVYVTARNSNSLLAFIPGKFLSDSANARVGTVPVGKSPVGVAVVNDGKQIVVTNSDRFAADRKSRQVLTVIDASRVAEGASAILGSIPAGAFPREFGISPDGSTLFVANYESNEIEFIDLKRMPIEPAKPAAAH